jgi:hypothetical protein
MTGTKLKTLPITADLKSQVSIGEMDKMCRLVVPPSQTDDTLHVARVMRYLLNRDFVPAKQLKIELRANLNITGAHARPRTKKTPKTPRTANLAPNYRSEADNMTELNLLLQRYPVNVAVIKHVNGSYTGTVVHEQGLVKDWTLLLVTKERHFEILASENADSTVSVVFTMNDPVFKSIFTKLNANAEVFELK